MNNILKYRRFIGIITLFCYFSIFSFNIFHYHAVNLSFFHELKQQNEGSGNSDLVNYPFIACKIGLTFNSIHAISLPGYFYFITEEAELVLKKSETNDLENLLLYNVSNLRAPPLFS
jgi:hypothetical protein